MRNIFLTGPMFIVSTILILSFTEAQANEKDGWLNSTIIHTNDIHSRVDPANTVGTCCPPGDQSSGNCYGGAARHKTLIERLRQGKKIIARHAAQAQTFFSLDKKNRLQQISLNPVRLSHSQIQSRQFKSMWTSCAQRVSMGSWLCLIMDTMRT